MGNSTKEERRVTVLTNQFNKSKPKQYGNLHERLQYLLKLVEKHRAKGKPVVGVPADIYAAVYDLRTEVRNYEPVDPPYGSRQGKVIGCLTRAGRGRGVKVKK